MIRIRLDDGEELEAVTADDGRLRLSVLARGTRMVRSMVFLDLDQADDLATAVDAWRADDLDRLPA